MASPPAKTGSKSSSKADSNRSVAHIAVQCGLGAVFFAIWALVGALMYQEDLAQIVVTGAPYFTFFVLGVLSRYIPGVKGVAKRLKSVLPAN